MSKTRIVNLSDWTLTRSDGHVTLSGNDGWVSARLSYYCYSDDGADSSIFSLSSPSHDTDPFKRIYYFAIAERPDILIRLESSYFDSKIGMDSFENLVEQSFLIFYSLGEEKQLELAMEPIAKVISKYQQEITECKNELRADIARVESIEAIKFGALLLAVLAGLYAGHLVIKKLRSLTPKVKNSTGIIAQKVKNPASILAQKVRARKEEKLKKLVAETALDEAVRQAVQSAAQNTVSPDDIKICPDCNGKGCNSCSDRGWTIKGV